MCATCGCSETESPRDRHRGDHEHGHAHDHPHGHANGHANGHHAHPHPPAAEAAPGHEEKAGRIRLERDVLEKNDRVAAENREWLARRRILALNLVSAPGAGKTTVLEQTIRELKGEDLEDERRAAVNLRLNLRIEEEYIPDMNQRLSAYRRLANARSLDEVDSIVAELRDRYGVPPPSVGNLAQYSRTRLVADRIGLDSVDREGQIVVLKFRHDAKLDPAMILKLVQSRGDLTLLPPAVLRLDLDAPLVRQGAPPASLTRAGVTRLVRPVPAESRSPESHRMTAAGQSGSWWTARASAGVAPGFTKEEIQAADPLDPSRPGGLFERLGELLGQLSQSLVPS